MIDPTVVFSTVVGGSSVDQAEAVAVDTTGAVYLTGYTTSTNIPSGVSSGNTRPAVRGGSATDEDVFVIKLNPAGTSIVYATYLGGSANDRGYSIAVDSAGIAYVTGETLSSDFPKFSPLTRSLSATDAFVSKLTASGSSLTLSGMIGGSGDDYGYGLALDSSNNIYIVGATTSGTMTNNTGGTNRQGTQDAFVARVIGTGSGSISWQRFYGGIGVETAYAITVRGSDLYVAGETTSTTVTGTTAPLQSAAGGTDAFLMKLDKDTGNRTWWAFYGGPNAESGRAVAADSLGNVYMGGNVNTGLLPTQNPVQATFGGGSWDGFVMVTNTNASTLLGATYLGGSGNDFVTGMTIDPSQSVFVTGYTLSPNFPAVSTQLKATAASGTNQDAFLTKYRYRLGGILISTLLGGNNTDTAYGLASDATGVYVAGTTLSTDLTTASGWTYLNGTTPGSLNNRDAFVRKITSTCNFSFNPNPLSFTAAGGPQTVFITVSSECGWVATTSDSFLTLSANPYGGGNGAITVTASANAGTTARTGTVTIGGVALPVTQASACTYQLPNGGVVVGSGISTGSVTVTPSSGACTWTATSNAPWIRVTETTSTAVTYRVASNPLPTQRLGTLTVAGTTYTIMQAGRARLPQSTGIMRDGAWRIDAARQFMQNASNVVFQWGEENWVPVAGDWSGDGISKVGAFNLITGYWLLDVNNNLRLDAGDAVFHWGNSTYGTMTPLVGDWNGDGIDEVGVYLAGNWYLDLNGSRMLDAGESFAWGPANGVPMVGDWNGDGTWKVGSYNPSNGVWILDTNGDRAYQFPSDFVFQWGSAGFTPIVGDFFGLGRQTVGAYYQGRFWLESGDGFSNVADRTFTLVSNSTGVPLVGDWNNTGTAKAGIVTGNSFTLDYDGDGVLNLAVDKQFTFGNVGDTLVVGRWSLP